MYERRNLLRVLTTLSTVAVALIVSAGAIRATTLIRLGFSDLARQADRIVTGTVTRVEGHWDDSFRFIHSSVTLKVDRSLRGAGPSEVTLRTPGGFVGGTGHVAHGAATFEVGERVLVFLVSWEDGAAKVLGYAQGKSRIVVDQLGQERLEGGSANGRTLQGVIRELRDGPDHNVPLHPTSEGGRL